MRNALSPALALGAPGPARAEPARVRRPAFPTDLHAVPTAELNSLCNRMYRCLDRRQPAPGSLGRYYQIIDELDRRASSRKASAMGGHDVQGS
jgi:hypothetical protein